MSHGRQDRLARAPDATPPRAGRTLRATGRSRARFDPARSSARTRDPAFSARASCADADARPSASIRNRPNISVPSSMRPILSASASVAAISGAVARSINFSASLASMQAVIARQSAVPRRSSRRRAWQDARVRFAVISGRRCASSASSVASSSGRSSSRWHRERMVGSKPCRRVWQAAAASRAPAALRAA